MSNTTVTDHPETANPFRTDIIVAGCVVATSTITGGNEPDELAVTLMMPERHMTFSPESACALAAALQAVAVHQLEEPRELRRNTEPGTPDQHGVGGGL